MHNMERVKVRCTLQPVAKLHNLIMFSLFIIVSLPFENIYSEVHTIAVVFFFMKRKCITASTDERNK
jgi:hypothetical protein